MQECVFKGQFEGREGASCHLNYPLHVGSICAMLKCVRVFVSECVCVRGGGGGCCGSYTPSYSPPSPLKGCIKEEGGKAPLSLCSQTQRQSHSHWTHKHFGHTHSSGTYWLSGEKRYFCVLDSPSGGPSGLKQRRKKERPEPRWASSVQLRARRTLRTFGKLSSRS